MGPMARIKSFVVLLAAASAVAQTPSVDIKEPRFHVAVRAVVFDDTVGLPAIVARSAAHAVTSRTYSADCKSEIAEIARDVLQQYGYFKAEIEDPVRFRTVSHTKNMRVVDVHINAILGPRYRLSSVSFRGTTAFPPGVLRGQFPINDGDVFDIAKVRRGIHRMKDLYCSEGYEDFAPVPDLTFDEQKQQISMLVAVDEGPRYRVGKLTVDGEESQPGARQRLVRGWAKYQGSYRCDPIRDVLNDLHARPNLPLDQMVRMDMDHENHIINYTITLGKPVSAGLRRSH
jgi:hypothetical protein